MRRCQIDIFPCNCDNGFHPIFNKIGGKNPKRIQVKLGSTARQIYQCAVARLTFFHLIAMMDSIRYSIKSGGKILKESRWNWNRLLRKFINATLPDWHGCSTAWQSAEKWFNPNRKNPERIPIRIRQSIISRAATRRGVAALPDRLKSAISWTII